jgi:hypothetical protein
VQQVDVDAVAGPADRVELGGVDLVVGALRVVNEGDPTPVGAALQGPQHRHHRGDAGAAGEEQDVVGHPVGEHELALRLGQVHDRAGPGALDEEARHEPVGVGPQRDGDPVAVARVGTGDREHPGGAAGAVDLDADLHVLAGAVTAPGGGRLEGEGRDRRVPGHVHLASYVDDPGAHLPGGPHRVDDLEVPVHAVRRGEGLQRAGPENGSGDAHREILSVNIRTLKT